MDEQAADNSVHFDLLFDYAPVPLWEQDFSAVKAALDGLKSAGVTDLGEYAGEHPGFVEDCIAKLRPVRPNRKVLELYGVSSLDELAANLQVLFRGEMRAVFMQELQHIWEGRLEFTGEGVNYTLAGETIDILLSWRVLPGSESTFSRVLVNLDNITARKQAERAQMESEMYFRTVFEHSPSSLWVEDFSQVKRYLEDLRAQNIDDFTLYLAQNPQMITECMRLVRVLDVNQKTLEIYNARDKKDLIEHLPLIFRDEMRDIFREEMIEIWNGRREFEHEGVNYALNGDRLDIILRWSVMPGFEQDLSRTLLSIADVTSRKKAENYLKYLGTHDVLTGLYNRTFLEEERDRLERGRRFPVSIVIADVNGLKEINDLKGHAAGDDLLRRVGEVLRAAFRRDDVVARVGGDEFAIVMPECDQTAANQAVQRIRNLIALNNTYYQGPTLSLAVGLATGERGESLVVVQRKADDAMYQDKRRQKNTL